MSYLVTTDRAQFDIDRIHGMLRDVYWSKGIRRDVVERAFANSLAAVAVEESSGLIVGVARVVTDGRRSRGCATSSWIRALRPRIGSSDDSVARVAAGS
jgi:hypothetical protein